jgi:hypothetical protein
MNSSAATSTRHGTTTSQSQPPTELGEERDSRVQVVDDDGDVVHPLNGHLSDHKPAVSRRSGVPKPAAHCWWGSGGLALDDDQD